MLLDLIDEGSIGPRYNVFLMVPATMTLEQALNWRATGLTDRPGRYDIRGIKLFADGGYGSYDAAVNHAYCDCVALEPGSKGILSFADSELADVLTKIAGSGMQVAIHTNGERSQEQVCRVARSIDLAGDPPMRLEHAGNWVWDPRDTRPVAQRRVRCPRPSRASCGPWRPECRASSARTAGGMGACRSERSSSRAGTCPAVPTGSGRGRRRSPTPSSACGAA